MTKQHLLEIRQGFRAECTPNKGGPTVIEQLAWGARIEAQVRPFVADGVERADLYLPTCTYRNVPFKYFMFIDREPNDLATS